MTDENKKYDMFKRYFLWYGSDNFGKEILNYKFRFTCDDKKIF